MVHIRPHHILCTRAFMGKGYSSCFVSHMSEIVRQIQADSQVHIIKGTDDICSACPEKENGKCKSAAKVLKFDNEVIRYLNIEYKFYQYALIEEKIQKEFTEEVFNNICGDCEWKKTGSCRYEDIKRKWLTAKKSEKEKL